MEKTSKTPKIILILVIFLFIIFVSLFVAQKNGYYEYSQYNKMTLTESSIKRFESDIESGKNITIKDYLENSYKDYSNTISTFGNKVGQGVEYVFKYGLQKGFKVINKLFLE